jgi:hypothetical protein
MSTINATTEEHVRKYYNTAIDSTIKEVNAERDVVVAAKNAIIKQFNDQRDVAVIALHNKRDVAVKHLAMVNQFPTTHPAKIQEIAFQFLIENQVDDPTSAITRFDPTSDNPEHALVLQAVEKATACFKQMETKMFLSAGRTANLDTSDPDFVSQMKNGSFKISHETNETFKLALALQAAVEWPDYAPTLKPELVALLFKQIAATDAVAGLVYQAAVSVPGVDTSHRDFGGEVLKGNIAVSWAVFAKFAKLYQE